MEDMMEKDDLYNGDNNQVRVIDHHEISSEFERELEQH